MSVNDTFLLFELLDRILGDFRITLVTGLFLCNESDDNSSHHHEIQESAEPSDLFAPEHQYNEADNGRNYHQFRNTFHFHLQGTFVL